MVLNYNKKIKVKMLCGMLCKMVTSMVKSVLSLKMPAFKPHYFESSQLKIVMLQS